MRLSSSGRGVVPPRSGYRSSPYENPSRPAQRYPTFPLDNHEKSRYNIQADGVWRSLVSRLVRDQEASGSNPDTPTIIAEHYR